MMEPLADAQSFGSLANFPVGDIGGAPRGIWRDALHVRGENGMRRAFNILDVSVQNRVRSRDGDVPSARGPVEGRPIKDYI